MGPRRVVLAKARVGSGAGGGEQAKVRQTATVRRAGRLQRKLGERPGSGKVEPW